MPVPQWLWGFALTVVYTRLARLRTPPESGEEVRGSHQVLQERPQVGQGTLHVGGSVDLVGSSVEGTRLWIGLWFVCL